MKIVWESYSGHLQDLLHDMWTSDDLTDVTLVCDENKEITPKSYEGFQIFPGIREI